MASAHLVFGPVSISSTVLLLLFASVSSCRTTSGSAASVSTSDTLAVASNPADGLVGSGSDGAAESDEGSDELPSIDASYVFDVGCASDVDARLAVKDQLDDLERWCVPGFSVVPIDMVADGRWSFDLPASVCIRIGVAATARRRAVRVLVRGESGGENVFGVGVRLPALVPSDGPVCFGDAGKYVVEVTGGLVQLRVWVKDLSG